MSAGHERSWASGRGVIPPILKLFFGGFLDPLGFNGILEHQAEHSAFVTGHLQNTCLGRRGARNALFWVGQKVSFMVKAV
jgi:hypothetical protein